MVRNVVIPANTSVLTSVFLSLSLKNFSIDALLADDCRFYSSTRVWSSTVKSLFLSVSLLF
jgi:hypothetical protein